MIKRIDSLGRVVVPKGYRTMLGLKPGDALDIQIDGGKLTMKPHKGICTFCGSNEIRSVYMGKGLCAECLKAIKLLQEA